MKKSLIALAVAGIVAAPAAMAEATIYGQARAAYEIFDGGTGYQKNTNVTSRASRIAVKGSEDLGNGLSATWGIGANMATTDSNDSIAGFGERDGHVGISGGFGTLVLGHGDKPSKVYADRSNFGDTLGGPVVMNFGGGENAVVYSTPDMNGFSATLAIGAAAESVTTAGAAKATSHSFGAGYTAGPLYIGLGYDGDKSAATPSVKTSTTSLTVTYGFDALSVGGTYQRRDLGAAASGDTNAYLLNVAYSLGSDVIKAEYSKINDATTALNDSGSQISVGYDHNMSKNTTVFALYTRITNDTGASRSSAARISSVTAGNDPSGFSFGINHSF